MHFLVFITILNFFTCIYKGVVLTNIDDRGPLIEYVQRRSYYLVP